MCLDKNNYNHKLSIFYIIYYNYFLKFYNASLSYNDYSIHYSISNLLLLNLIFIINFDSITASLSSSSYSSVLLALLSSYSSVLLTLMSSYSSVLLSYSSALLSSSALPSSSSTVLFFF